MDLTLKIEGGSKAVRDFIHYIRMDKRYTFYSHAKYLFSPMRDQVELVFTGGDDGGAGTDEADWGKIS
ncbi:hypothetical protein [Shimazuella kribbensis]|uniref:hypothetical protein n=1 Tax=Shimazuella kribbensis TaxID=139808 RepID=UPI0003FBB54C|nr:hypothetical protein [Shimazuella kribbensis]